MSSKLGLLTICLWCLIVPNVLSQNFQIIYGQKSYTQLEPGNVNILISTPHDGQLQPATITTRTNDVLGNLVGDTNTGLIARAIRDELQRLFLVNKNVVARPYLVANNLVRAKMDPNRNSSECCYNYAGEDSGLAFNDYHQTFIQGKFGSYMASNSYKLGLIVDVHGQAHPEGWIEVGYIIDPSNFPNPVLSEKLASRSSLNHLRQYSSQSLETLVRGSKYSFGDIVTQKFGYKITPSPSYPNPFNTKYYNGGPITQMYTSDQFKSFKLAGFQMELPQALRFGSNSTLTTIGQNLASCIYDYYWLHSFDAKI